jgi:hypothetical protein
MLFLQVSTRPETHAQHSQASMDRHRKFPHILAHLEAQLLLVGGKHQSALLGLRLRVLPAVPLVACRCLLGIQ